jgi:GT2 family glycosyltransferase/glycosyltransferase involved in cell wall biosynthesis
MSKSESTVLGLVSILVLNWNKPDLTIKAVKSLMSGTFENVEIIVIDNGSDKGKRKKLRSFCDSVAVKFLDIGTNRYFGEGNNIGAEAASGEFLVFLNNDVEVKPGWLTPLLELICKDASVGAVGPKFVYPNGVLQEAGAFIDENGRSIQIGKGQDPEDPRFNYNRDVHYVSAACLLMRKSDFMSIQGFNFIYEPAYYEDTDLCFSIRSLGKRVVYEPKSVVTHFESATTADPTSSLKLNNISEFNRAKFLNRWSGDRVPMKYVLPETKITTKKQKTIGVYTPFHLTIGGGERYILSVAHALSTSNFKVELITDFEYSRLRIQQLSHYFGLDLSNVILTTRLDAMKRSYDLLICMGNELVASIPPIGKRNVFHCQFPFVTPGKLESKIDELKKFDAVVVNSEFTRFHYQAAASALGIDIKIDIISPPIDSLNVNSSRRTPKKILSVGRFFVGGHTKRQDALILAFRELAKTHPDATLDLVGGLLPGNEHRKFLERCVEMAAGLNINFHIDTEPEALESLYSEASIYWHATGFEVDFNSVPEQCEHFGMSVVEAMSAGLIPVAVGSGGPAEIIDFGVNGFLFHTLENLTRRTDLLFNLDSADLDYLRTNAISASKKYDKSLFFSRWQAIADGLL